MYNVYAHTYKPAGEILRLLLFSCIYIITFYYNINAFLTITKKMRKLLYEIYIEMYYNMYFIFHQYNLFYNGFSSFMYRFHCLMMKSFRMNAFEQGYVKYALQFEFFFK